MALIDEIVEGWTSRISWQLSTRDRETGVETDLVGTGFTVSALDLVGSDGTVVDTSSDFGWITQADGTVYYDPDASDFVAAKSPYRVRVQLTDGAGKVEWFPNGQADEIRVFGRYS